MFVLFDNLVPQSDLGAERDIMAAEGASGTPYAPGDIAAFPACAEDQVGSPGLQAYEEA